MRKRDVSVLQEAQLFAARFGFLNQEIFFRYLCTKSRSQKYFYWKTLVDDGWFFRSNQNPKVLYLSRKSRSVLGNGCIPARDLMYVDHDSHMGSFLLSLSRTNLLVRSWTEADLTRAPWESFQILGTDRFAKIPDLILDVRTSNGFLRIAVEIEKTRKAKSRYAQIALSYLEMSRVDLVIFGCDTEAIAKEIRDAFRGEGFAKGQKIPGVFLLDDFDKHLFNSKFTFNEREFKFHQFIRGATRLGDIHFPSMPDDDRTRVRPSKDEIREVA